MNVDVATYLINSKLLGVMTGQSKVAFASKTPSPRAAWLTFNHCPYISVPPMRTSPCTSPPTATPPFPAAAALGPWATAPSP